MNDMKKTFQREMKPSSSSIDPNHGSGGMNGFSGSSPSPPSSSPSPSPGGGGTVVSGASAFNPGAYGGLGMDMPMTTSQDLVLMTEVNYKYLKHVIFKFFTSRDYEVCVRVLISYFSKWASLKVIDGKMRKLSRPSVQLGGLYCADSISFAQNLLS